MIRVFGMMQHLRSYLVERLRKKQLTGKASAALVIQVCRRFVLYPEALQGKLQHGTLFLRAHPHEDKMAFFLRKAEILKVCKEELIRVGSSVPIVDLKFSQ